ncbi:efflux RND transporter periplasmic adaptor subunit [Catalinimonas niigatensis]|uniref:efflux RND transporter periplasmic adaptor subunit n=1 Tax=Catalinimonas niigatensis TaxID=1397264 RepID=UPI002664E843|nr:efflux RND transporter periplasmic adaptor subunit [Catalinimonas niigatensis]WPP50847.1 efflux RND transporter periplasmic adaptor subunit [Catalinimonas niigatensis]
MNNKKKKLLICLVILVVGGAITSLIFLTEPTASRTGATKETAMLVEVTEVERGTFQPTIVATGTVQPSKEIILSARVSGEVNDRYPEFTPGGFVRKGEPLLQIDPADYRNTLELRKSDLQQAVSALNIEMGRQDVAQKGYQLVDESLPGMNTDLVLREPQLNAVKASVQAARAAVNQAELNLQRTRIKAPFDAHILSRNVNEGSQVAVGDNLGRLVGMDEYWVVVNVPLSSLRWLSFSDSDEQKGSMVRVRDRKAWGEGEYRTGYLYKMIGALENQTRLARVLVSVPDPLSYRNDSLPVLMINGFVEAHIQAEEIEDVIRLSRDYVRDDETVWVMEDEKLQIREVDIVFSDAKYAYLRSGLHDGDQIVMTNLATVSEGASLRLEGDDSETEQDSLSSMATKTQAQTQSSQE